MTSNANGLSNNKSMRTIRSGWLIFALVMIFNPNIQLIDLLPDFIGYFILAKFFEKAADAAPFFDEARSAFLKLGYISLAKIPALALVLIIRSHNTLDNDIVALMSLAFAVIELMYLIPAIKNIFDALTYLGERSDAYSLIKNDSLVSTEALRPFTFVFAIFKCILYTLPEFLKLTRSVEIGNTTSMLTGSRYYPWAIMASVLLGFVFGGVWLSRMSKFVKSIKKEGKFYSALENLASASTYSEYEKKVYYRSVNRTFLMFILSAVFSVDLIFSNYNDINLMPSFISGVFFTVGLIGLARHTKKDNLKAPVAACGVIYNIVSLVKYVLEVSFLEKFGYRELYKSNNKEALKQYLSIEILACAELLFYIGLTVLFFILMKNYTESKLGRFNENSNERIKKQYYKEINVKTIILTALSTLVGLVSFANVFINGNIKIIFTDSSDITMPTLFVPYLPWFGLVITIASLVYSFYSVYYFNFVKEEERL